MSDLDVFIRQIRSRSTEHKKAMSLLEDAQLYGQMVSVLRQEIDSMVRIIYLLSLKVEQRPALIAAVINGEKWKVTDKEMVDLAQRLHGWTRSVYKFGCAFIHLSAFHDYSARDPIALLSEAERKDMLQHCRHYHGGPQGDDPTFADYVPYFPAVLEKITGNLGCYLDDLIANTDFETI